MLHDMLKLYKHGYSKVTDHATREIRHGRITGRQAVELVKKHEMQPFKYSKLFNQWLNLKHEGLGFMLDQHRNKRFWSETILDSGCSLDGAQWKQGINKILV